MTGNEHHIHIAGEFDLVALALLTMRSTLEVIENSESHLLFTIPEGGAGIARPAPDDSVEVVVLDPQSKQIADRVAAALAAVLDYPVVLQTPVGQASPDSYSSTFDAGSRTLFLGGQIDESDLDLLRDDLAAATETHTRSATVDLTDVSFLASRAIGVLVVSQESARGADAEITLRTAAGSITHKILTILSLPHQTSASGSTEVFRRPG